ncbi:MAG: cobalamin-binding protein [Deltaproteobacteria bacterium]|nr:cobalamin-binding protein [Deltaproteobacteria bacterium]
MAIVGAATKRAPPSAAETGVCRRVVSLAPSITEMLFALGLGDRVVGTTRYCNYPAEARNKARIGGYVDPSYELIVELRPDLVLALGVHEAAIEVLGKVGIRTLTLDLGSVRDILRSIRTVGLACGVGPRAETLVASIEERLSRVRSKTARLERPRVLVSVGRDEEAGYLKDVYAAGQRSYLDEVIELAGGENAVGETVTAFPGLSAEGIITINPEVIIDILAHGDGKKTTNVETLGQWAAAGRTQAVRNGRVHVFEEDYATIPGPRVALLVEQFARLIHPEIDWSPK